MTLVALNGFLVNDWVKLQSPGTAAGCTPSSTLTALARDHTTTSMYLVGHMLPQLSMNSLGAHLHIASWRKCKLLSCLGDMAGVYAIVQHRVEL